MPKKVFTDEDIENIKRWLLTRQNIDEIVQLTGKNWRRIRFKIYYLGLRKLLNPRHTSRKYGYKTKDEKDFELDPNWRKKRNTEYEKRMREIYLELFNFDIFDIDIFDYDE